jgi:hypothetical protein
MGKHLIRLCITWAVFVLLAAAVLYAAQRGGGQRGQRAANAEPSPPHDPHDLSGIWVRRGGVLALSNDPPPFTPEGKKRFDANKPSYGPRAIPPALGNDPMGNCDPLGIPRLLLLENNPGDFEFIQIPGRVLQLFDRHHVHRIVWTDGRGLPNDPDPRMLGLSVGHWEQDTFVVQTIGFDERTWLDHFGYPHSEEMTLEERYHRLDRDNMQLVITLTDPKIYTKPWVSEIKNLRLSPLKDFVDELFCIPSEEQEFNRRIRNPAGGLINKE